jgi:hypothetical protein
VRATAIETLASLGDRRAAALLGKLVREEAFSTRFNTKWATTLLVELGGTEAIPDLEASVKSAGALRRWRLRRAITALRKSERA